MLPETQCEKDLILWFKKSHETLPWRLEPLSKKRDPYIVWISEIMLQQTQVASVVEHFNLWIKKFPDVKTLSKANEKIVLQHWQGLGYYSRAKNILKTAKIISTKYNGNFPESRKELETLPGIGKYTAGAILSLAFHKSESILDGNLIRIFSRFYLLDFLPDNSFNQKIYWDKAHLWAKGEKGFLKNEALMELGRNICKPKGPLCSACPLRLNCLANKETQWDFFPPKKKTHYQIFEGIIFVAQSEDDKFFVIENSLFFLKGQKTFPHFPYSSLKAKEIPPDVEDFLPKREILQFHFGKEFKHSITHYKITFQTLFLKIKGMAPKNNLWISKKELKKLPSSLCKKTLKALDSFI